MRGNCETEDDEVNCSQSEEIADLGIEFQLLNSLAGAKPQGIVCY